jgi:hypothetical protein
MKREKLDTSPEVRQTWRTYFRTYAEGSREVRRRLTRRRRSTSSSFGETAERRCPSPPVNSAPERHFGRFRWPSRFPTSSRGLVGTGVARPSASESVPHGSGLACTSEPQAAERTYALDITRTVCKSFVCKSGTFNIRVIIGRCFSSNDTSGFVGRKSKSCSVSLGSLCNSFFRSFDDRREGAVP